MHSIKNEIKGFYLLVRSYLFRNRHVIEKIIYIVKRRFSMKRQDRTTRRHYPLLVPMSTMSFDEFFVTKGA